MVDRGVGWSFIQGDHNHLIPISEAGVFCGYPLKNLELTWHTDGPYVATSMGTFSKLAGYWENPPGSMAETCQSQVLPWVVSLFPPPTRAALWHGKNEGIKRCGSKKINHGFRFQWPFGNIDYYHMDVWFVMLTVHHKKPKNKKSSINTSTFQTCGAFFTLRVCLTSGQITIIPKPELRAFLGGFPY